MRYLLFGMNKRALVKPRVLLPGMAFFLLSLLTIQIFADEVKKFDKPLSSFVTPYPKTSITRVQKVTGDTVAMWRGKTKDSTEKIIEFYQDKSRYAKGWKVVAIKARIIMLAKGEREFIILLDVVNDQTTITYKLNHFKC